MTKVKLKDATKELAAEAQKVLGDATRVRKGADSLVQSLKKLESRFQREKEEAAAQLGRSPSALANKLRLLRLSPACRELLVQNGLTERHARCLLRLEDGEERLAALRHIADKQLNVAQAEQYIDQRLAQLQSTPPRRRTFILKDVRLFLNSLDRGLRMVREAGVDARTERQETDDAILLTIRIPKQRQTS